MNFTLTSLIPLIAFFLYLGLYLATTFSKASTQIQERNAFKAYLAMMLLWALAAFLLLASVDNHPTFWFRLMAFGAVGSAVTLINFVRRVTAKRWVWINWVYVYGIVSFLLMMFTPLGVQYAVMENSEVHYEFGPLLFLIAGPGYLLIIFSLFSLIRRFQESDDVIIRNRLRYLILGFAIILFISLVNFTPLGKYPIDLAGNSITAMLISYAILRHQLLDIKVIIRRSILYSVPTIMIGTVYFLIISFALTVFSRYSNVEIFGVSFFVAIITALIAQPFRDKAQSIIDRLFFREKYDSSLMLQRLSSRTALVLDLEQVTNMILKDLTETLHIQNAAFFLKRGKGTGYYLSAQIGLEPFIKIRMNENHPIVLWLSSHKSVLGKKELDLLPYFKSLWRREREDLEKLNGELFIPLLVKTELVGIFVIGPKRSDQGYSPDDQLTLTTLANQTAVAIENARLYRIEQDRREELTMLFNMSRQLVATDDVDTVINTITQYATISTNVTYARILTPDSSGSFVCRAAHSVRDIDPNLKIGKVEPEIMNVVYRQIQNSGNYMILEKNGSSESEEFKMALFLDLATSVCIYPLKVVDEFLGLLILGEERHTQREPFDANKLQLISLISDQAASALRRSVLHAKLEESFIETVVALANAVEARDTYTEDHSARMEELVVEVCRQLSFPEEEIINMRWAARLHDIGKIGVPDQILRKPGSLNEEEWVLMKQHPQIGSKILAPISKMASVSPIIRAHHEKFNGMGYPDGLANEQIPLGARILAVVDAYVAMTDDRIYRKSLGHEKAVSELIDNKGSQFDPEIVDIFLKIIEKTDHQNVDIFQ
ncbi:MAG: HD domain-containing protein [Anaerolineaceae bacterium]|jgi:HD-GYP domain-containing protein (c-di-GMP phosphodiesterase class II)|nr:HD domain-containing protein [Anaerolineaceae bacterium]